MGGESDPDDLCFWYNLHRGTKRDTEYVFWYVYSYFVYETPFSAQKGPLTCGF